MVGLAGAAGSASAAGSAVTDLRAAEQRLIGRVGHWTPARWAGTAAGKIIAGKTDKTTADKTTVDGPGRTRADVVHALVQRLADLGAEAERRPRRAVPRLPSDPALTDQVRVMVADLARSGAPESRLRVAAAAIDGTLAAL
ncbi:MAG: hypothetical protein ACM30G_12325 [Micromonosporaceae bacterium]